MTMTMAMTITGMYPYPIDWMDLPPAQMEYLKMFNVDVKRDARQIDVHVTRPTCSAQAFANAIIVETQIKKVTKVILMLTILMKISLVMNIKRTERHPVVLLPVNSVLVSRIVYMHYIINFYKMDRCNIVLL
jgi:hypothetical protein